MRVSNFNPGPAVLPVEVLEEVREAVLEYRSEGNTEGCGMGIMEISHRSAEFEAILNSAAHRVKRLLHVPDDYSILFCQGGATQQFSMVPLNLAADGEIPGYLISGVWAQKAYEEAVRLTGGIAVGSSAPDYRTVPALSLSDDQRETTPYIHYTSNNTVYGTQWPALPPTDDIPLVCDASSDLFSKPIHIKRHAAVYACAQKNFGCAGVTLVIVKGNSLKARSNPVPIMLQYRTYTEFNSLYNTPPTYAIYVLERYLAWIERSGGVAEMHKQALGRAETLYQCLDAHPLYHLYADRSARSTMNITFQIADPGIRSTFLTEAVNRGIYGLAGHKLLGGMRISLYNGCTTTAVQELVSFLKDFAIKWG